MSLAALGLRDHVFTHEQAQLDADTGKPDALPSHFRAGRDVMIAPHLCALHAGAVIHGGEGALRGISRHHNPAGAGVQRVGDDLRENGFFETGRIRIPQVFQQMFEINARLTLWCPLRKVY